MLNCSRPFRLLFVLLTLFGCASSEAPVQTPPSVGKAPVTEFPAFRVGDEWRTTGAVFRVVAIEDGMVVVTRTPNARCPGCRYHRDREWNLVKITDEKNNAAQEPGAGIKMVTFPLTVGRQWTSNQEMFSSSANRLLPYENTFKVDSYGPVRTKAGTFNAYQISWLQENKGTYGWTGRATVWYSPDVRWWVKGESHASGWFAPWELESYTLK